MAKYEINEEGNDTYSVEADGFQKIGEYFYFHKGQDEKTVFAIDTSVVLTVRLKSN